MIKPRDISNYKIAIALHNKGLNNSEIAKYIQPSVITIGKWIQHYCQNLKVNERIKSIGDENFEIPKNIVNNWRERYVQAYHIYHSTNITINILSKALNITPATIKNWILKYEWKRKDYPNPDQKIFATANLFTTYIIYDFLDFISDSDAVTAEKLEATAKKYLKSEPI